MPSTSPQQRCLFRSKRSRQRGVSSLLVIGCLLLALVSVTGGGAWYYLTRESDSEDSAFTHTVQRAEFVLKVTERGEIESAENVDIRCEVAQRSGRGVKILEIVPEGTQVEPGGFLVRLDSAELEQEQIKQKIEVTNKEAALEEARNKLETSKIALDEYQYGTYEQEKKQLQGEFLKAKENMKLALEYLEHSKRLAAKGYIPQQQLEADAFALKSAETELQMVETKQKVLEKYTKEKKLKDLNSEINIARAKKGAADEALALEEDKLEDLDDQIAKCLIRAPSKGVVKYAREDRRRSDDSNIIEEGREVYQRQLLIQLPNTENMRARMKVNESIVNRIKEGMPAQVTIVGLRDAVLPGRVSKVYQYSEPSSWRSGGVKEYTIEIQIEGNDSRLRTGMTAQVAVECLRKQDAIQVPVQAIYAQGKKHFCVLEKEGQQVARPIELGVTNDKYVVIRNGLDTGDIVSLSPDRFFHRKASPTIEKQEAKHALQEPPTEKPFRTTRVGMKP